MAAAPATIQQRYDPKVPVAKLEPHPANVNEGDVGAIGGVMEELGFFGACLVQSSTNRIIAGKHRWLAAQAEGKADVPCLFADVDDDTALRIMLADNRTARLGHDNEQELADLLVSLAQQTERGLGGTGFDRDDLDCLLADLAAQRGFLPANPDEVTEPPVEPITRPGDLWELGEHRLLCGDTTDEAAVGLLMDGTPAALVFTDPPYGVDYDGGTKARTKLAGDTGTALYGPACLMAAAFSDAEAALYLWHAGVKGIAAAAAAAAAAAGYEIRCELVWNKNQAQFGALGAQYKQKHEPCYYCFKRGKAPRWYGPANEVTVWDVDRSSVNEFHPTQKPVELAARAARNSSERGDVVLDLFGGSGATLIACEQVGRIARLMEIDPGYCDVSARRFQNLTGIKPVRDGQPHDFLADG